MTEQLHFLSFLHQNQMRMAGVAGEKEIVGSMEKVTWKLSLPYIK